MLSMTLTAAWSRKRRLVGTAVAIVLGVAFLAATLVLSDSAKAGFRTAFSEANAGTDAVVRSATALTGAEAVRRPPIELAVLDTVSGIDGVEAAVPTVEGVAQVLDASGSPIGGDGPPTVGAGWVTDADLSPWHLVEGRPPAGPGEAVLDRATAEAAGAGVGGTVTVLVPTPVEVTVTGIAAFADGEDSIGGMTYVAFTTEEAQRLLLGSTEVVSGIVVAAEDGVAQTDLTARLADVLPDGTEAITGAELTREQEEQIQGDFLGFFTNALLVFAFVALLVAAFSIFNTFSILVAQRTRESALLRALGASRRQVLLSALAESGLVGLVGSALGVGAGLVIASGMLVAMDAAGFGLPIDGLEVSAGTIALAVAVGLVVTMVGGVGPAWRSSRVAPLAALRESAVDVSGTSRVRAVLGGLAAVLGVALMLRAGGDGGLGGAGLGAAALVVGVILLGPLGARPVGVLLGAPLALRGVPGDLARRNAVRNPRRTAATSAALLVGVGVVTLFTVFGASLSRSFEDAVDRSFGGDLVVTPAGSGFSGAGLSTAMIEDIAALSEVEAAAGLGYGPATLDGRQDDVGFADPQALAAVADFEVVDGDLGGLGEHDVAMAADHASDQGWSIGDTITVGFPDGASEEVTLRVTYDARAIDGDVLLSDRLWARHDPQPSVYVALVGLADGVGVEEGRAAIASLTDGAGAPEIMDRQQFIDAELAQVDVLLTVIYALLAVAILIALMGIANTLSLSVHERTRELGLLRAVGQSRSSMRAMVRWESVIVATFGSLCGLGLGLFLGWGLVQALAASDDFLTLAVPLRPLAAVLVVGAGVGVLAGLRPAWRASRLDPLAALSAE